MPSSDASSRRRSAIAWNAHVARTRRTSTASTATSSPTSGSIATPSTRASPPTGATMASDANKAEFSIAIDAPIETVWRVMTDLARYSEWNPFVVKIDGPLEVGGALKLEVQWESGGGASTVEVVTRLDAPSGGRAAMEYVFTGWLPRLALVRGSRLQALEQEPGKPTVYTTTEHFSGLLAGAIPLKKVRRGFQQHGE